VMGLMDMGTSEFLSNRLLIPGWKRAEKGALARLPVSAVV